MGVSLELGIGLGFEVFATCLPLSHILIFRGFAEKAITNVVLKFGDNQPKGREVTGGNFVENLRKSNYAKTKVPIKMIFRCFTAKVITNIVLKFGDNRANEKGVTGKK